MFNNSPAALKLFATAAAQIETIHLLMSEYEEIRAVLEELGYGTMNFALGSEFNPLPHLELTGGNCIIDGPEVLDEFVSQGPIRRVTVEQAAKVRRFPQMAERDRLGAETGWTCFYCQGKGDDAKGPDRRAWHVDHVYPVSRGGDDEQDNHVLACATCNLKKHTASALEIFEEMRRRTFENFTAEEIALVDGACRRAVFEDATA